MSYQTNGYTNGTSSNGGYSSLRRFDFQQDSSRENSADERSRSRPGGYGGFNSYQSPSQSNDHIHGPSRPERGYARRSRDYGADNSPYRSNDRFGGDASWSASRSRSRPGARYGAAGNQIDEILRYIEQHWSFMASSDCVPIKVALQLMDPSSLGLQDQMQQFGEAHQQLQNALKVIVNEHHQGFNSSIGTFHKIQAAIQASQARVRTLRAGLVDAKRDLVGGAQRPELKSLATSSQAYDQMLQTIATIEGLQLVPDKLEAQIREKRYLGAVENLLEALAIIRKPELEEIGALSELRVHLSNQEQILTDLLIEELHNHLYLKSPYCEERWKSEVRRLTAASSPSESATTPGLDDERPIYAFLATYDGSKPLQEDTTRNPEADTFYYIQLLVESLNKMSRLDLAADKIEERLPVELFKVLERTLSEVEQRHPQSMMKNGRRRQQLASGAMASGPDADQRATLEDLLTMLYAKFEAIAEGHRVLFDVTSTILKREVTPASEAATLNRSFRELWKLLQSEIRSLLHDHLATDGHIGTKSRQQNNASANIFKSQPRDRNKRLFKLQDTLRPGKDGTTNTDLITEREDLEFILKASVPGLVNANATTLTKAEDADMTVADRSATGHKLLVSPSIFNMGILLPPSVMFLRNLKEIVPSNNSGVVPHTLTTFLDDFLINVFYPQLDETLIDLCGRCMSDMDTFQPDPKWAEVAGKPIFKGTRKFYAIIEGVCELLGRLPHEQSFSQLVVGQMRAYYDRCYEWSKGLLQRVGGGEGSSTPATPDGNAPKIRRAAELATDGDINEVVIELLKAQDDEKESLVLAEKESQLLLRHVKRRELSPADLIQDRKALTALCTLQVSMKWLASRCKTLRYISPYAVDTTNTQPTHSRRWTATSTPTLNSTNSSQTSPPTTPYLPLDEQTATAFDAVTTSFTELSTLILRTLHLDLRLHILYGISSALNTTYALTQPYNDPDPAILTLSTDLTSYSSVLSTSLLPKQQLLLTNNIHTPANTALVGLTSSIPSIDTHGFARMALNILVLQQTLKQLFPPSSLAKAAEFYELGSLGPEKVVTQGPKSTWGYATEDLKAMVRLCYDEERDEALGGREAMAARLGGWPERKQSLKRPSRPKGSRTPTGGGGTSPVPG